MISSIVLLVISFAVLGLLLGIASAYDSPILSPNIEDRDPAVQQTLFEECIKDQRSDGELTEEEYYGCAYSIYD